MPLSDEEARMLQQLERSLAAEDPDFASTLRGSKQMAHNRRIAVVAGLGFVVGVVLLFTGAVMALTWLGVLGFVTMLGTAYAFATAVRRGVGGQEQRRPQRPGSGGSPRQSSGGSFVDRMEQRWQKRQDGDDF